MSVGRGGRSSFWAGLPPARALRRALPEHTRWRGRLVLSGSELDVPARRASECTNSPHAPECTRSRVALVRTRTGTDTPEPRPGMHSGGKDRAADFFSGNTRLSHNAVMRNTRLSEKHTPVPRRLSHGGDGKHTPVPQRLVPQRLCPGGRGKHTPGKHTPGGNIRLSHEEHRGKHTPVSRGMHKHAHRFEVDLALAAAHHHRPSPIS